MKKSAYAKFGLAILKRRRVLGITQESLASRADLNRSYIGDVERGERNVSIQTVQKIAEALECEICELFSLPYFDTERMAR